MASNYVQPGETVTLTAPYAVSSGHGALFNANLFGVALGDVENAADGEFALCGVWDLLCSTDTIVQGGNVYWDDSAKQCDGNSTGHTLIGVAIEAKGSTTTVRVRLNGVSV